ncbi:MAG: hypothetical protein V4606_01240 [Patescibacteria group bacterium]
MNKNVYIILAVIIVLVIVIGGIIYTKNNSTPVTTVEYTDSQVTFPSTEGNVVTNNFLKDESVAPDVQNPGLYSLGNTFPSAETPSKLPNYVVMFDKNTGTFNIALLQKPFAQSRLAAEVYLKDLLKIDEEEMCQLSYVVTVPGYVDEVASGFDYRFSFCPDTAKL